MLRRNAITLRAFTATPRLAEILPPVRLANELPDWWQELDGSYERDAEPEGKRPLRERLTIKHCYGLQELYRFGLGIKLWSDVLIELDGRDGVTAVGRNAQVAKAGGVHPVQQYSGAFDSNVQHFKFNSPWRFVCEESVHFAWVHPCYHQRNPFRFVTMPGVVEYKHQHTTNINVLLPKHPNRSECKFSVGEMLVYILPLTQKPVRIVAEEVTREEMVRISFASQYTFRPLLFSRRMATRPYVPGRLRRWRMRFGA